jgi:hypothetical protein
MTATYDMTEIAEALTRLWTEAAPASARTTHMQRLTVLFQAGTRISTASAIIGMTTMLPADVVSEDWDWDWAFGQIGKTILGVNESQMVGLIKGLREYAELVKERVADDATDAEWLAMVNDSLRRRTAAAQRAGERTACGDKDALFLRDMRALLAPLTTL